MELLSPRTQQCACGTTKLARLVLLTGWVVASAAASAHAETLIRKTSQWHYLRGTTEASSPTTAWREPGFDDSAWPVGNAPFRYGDGSEGTHLFDMENNYSTLFARQEFVLASPEGVIGMELEVDYDDGGIIWLNGVEVFRSNASSEAADALASSGHESGVPEIVSLDDQIGLLASGTNVIAMQGFNFLISSSDFFLQVKLSVSRTSAPLVSRDSVWRYRPGTSEASIPQDAWRLPEFDDSDWEEGATPIGYGHGDETTVLGDMQGNYSSVYLRRVVDVPDLGDLDFVDVRGDADDSYVVWVNGQRVLSGSAAPTELDHDSVSKSGHPRGTVDEFRIQDPSDFFVEGVNVIAAQVFNVQLASTDLWFWLEMTSFESVADTKFSIDRGFYAEPFEVAITTATADAQIRYTTDGTWPSETDGTLYDGPVQISTTTVLRAIAFKDNLDPSDVDTQTYIFTADVLEQPALPDGFPATWPQGAGDYEMDQDIVTNFRYRDRIEDALLSLPTMSLVMDPDDMFGADGVYHNGDAKDNQNDQYERPVSMELIYPDGSNGEQVNCGLRPHSHPDLKRSFKLAFKKELGAAKLKTDLFRSSPLNSESAEDQFDRLVLRAGHNRSWSFNSNLDQTVFARDQWIRDTQIAVSGVGAHGMFVHLYVNGVYWGLYNPAERPDAFFTSTYFGGEKEDWYAVNHNGVIDGDTSQVDRLFDLATNSQLENDGPYAEVAELLHLPSYAEHLIVNWYAGTGDWPANNFYAGHRLNPPGPLRFFLWDGEECWDDFSHFRDDRSNDGGWVHPSFRLSTASFIARRAVSSWVWRALTENPEFMILFADRVYDLCFRGPLTESESRARWTAICKHIEEAVICESARWGDSVISPTRTLHDHWEPEYLRVRNESMPGNVSQFLSALRAEGFYPLANPATFNTSGGLVPEGFDLTLDRPSNGGQVYYTTDGSDPRKKGGSIGNTATLYDDESIQIDEPTLVKTRTRKNGEWSALGETTLYTPQPFDKLRITEIMYNPPDIGLVDGDEFEFIELKNIGSGTIDLSGVAFTQGISFEFPLGTTLGRDEFIVLIRNETEFTLRYPGVPYFGLYQKQLSNAGERVTLSDPFGEALISVEYNDKDPWAEEADGDGYSLVPVEADPPRQQDSSDEWRRSADLAGSPGRDDPDFVPPPTPDCNDNGVLDSQDISSGTSDDVDENGIPDECLPPGPSGPDCNGNGVIDSADISAGISSDVNGDGVPDECDPDGPPPPPTPDCNDNLVLDSEDIQSGFSDDRNGNGVPDECDDPPSADCNDNFIEDSEDIQSGLSDDRNGNGVPDECDDPPSADCNDNFIEDSEDIQSGLSDDRNGNGVPDECDDPPSADCNDNFIEDSLDILGGFSDDVNGNGVPDECDPAVENDCNQNSIEDEIDIALGASNDANFNGVPDECEPPIPPDCNENDIPDVEDLVSGTSLDRNDNGVPDECDDPPSADCNDNFIEDSLDILSGFSRDADGNAIPDECEEEPPLEIVAFIRGDANRDGRVDVSDAITTVDFVFQGIGVLRCPDATDANDDGAIDLADPIYSVNYFFIDGPAPRPPFPGAGTDPTEDLLAPCEF